MTRQQTIDRLTSAAIAVLLLALWEVAARLRWISPLAFPPPSLIATDFVTLWHQDLLGNVFFTLSRFLAGLAIGGSAGVLVGLCIGWMPRARRLVDPFIAAIHPVPKIVLFPLFIVIFGISEWSKLAAIALTVFFPSLINAAAGVRGISPLYFEVVRSYGGRRRDLFRHVVLAGSLPMVLSGLRIAANIGLLVTIAIEFTMASRGIGAIIWLSWQTMRTEDLYVGVITLSATGVTLNTTIQWLLRRLAPWQIGE